MKFKPDILFIKFVLVGILNTLFGYGCYALLLFLGIHYSLAVVISTICAILFNFKTSGTLVFNNRDNRLIFKFVSVYILTMVLNIIGLRIANVFGLNLYYAGFVLTIIMAFISFFLQKYYVFKKGEV